MNIDNVIPKLLAAMIMQVRQRLKSQSELFEEFKDLGYEAPEGSLGSIKGPSKIISDGSPRQKGDEAVVDGYVVEFTEWKEFPFSLRTSDIEKFDSEGRLPLIARHAAEHLADFIYHAKADLEPDRVVVFAKIDNTEQRIAAGAKGVQMADPVSGVTVSLFLESRHNEAYWTLSALYGVTNRGVDLAEAA